MPNLQELLTSSAAASALGWAFVDIYPKSGPVFIHGRFIRHGYEVADLPFDENGVSVPKGLYAFWVKIGPNAQLAKCGCVSHAEERKPCKHDIAFAISH